jgi:hypothetical protein
VEVTPGQCLEWRLRDVLAYSRDDWFLSAWLNVAVIHAEEYSRRLWNSTVVEKLRRLVESFLKALAPAGVFGGVLTLLVRLDFIRDKINGTSRWVIVIAVTVVILVLDLTVPALKNLWRAVLWGPYNLWLLLFGQVRLRRLVSEIHRLNESVLFARVAGLEGYERAPYHILFTHKGEHQHGKRTGRDDQYRMPGIPFDEADTVMRVWYQVTHTVRLPFDSIRPQCSRTIDGEMRREILRGSFAIVGSPKGNAACAELMSALEKMAAEDRFERCPKYLLAMKDVKVDAETERICYLKSEGAWPSLEPDPTTNAVNGKELTDYALLMRVPNVLADDAEGRRQRVLVLAGCKVAGQVALNDWMAKNLASLEERFKGHDFYVVLKVIYNFVGGDVPDLSTPVAIEQDEIIFRQRL